MLLLSSFIDESQSAQTDEDFLTVEALQYLTGYVAFKLKGL